MPDTVQGKPKTGEPYSFVDEFKKYVAKGSPYTRDITDVAKLSGVNPAMLMSSSYVEGYNGYIAGTFTSSPYYTKGLKEQDRRKYQFDGFAFGGLDMVGERIDKLKKKGYIPQDFDYKEFKAVNEKGGTVLAGAFQNPKDALIMKAAILKDEQDNINDYVQKKKAAINPEHMDYFTMAAYNGGIGNAREMIDEYLAAEDKDKFISEGMTKKKQIHRNIAQRTELYGVASEVLTQ